MSRHEKYYKTAILRISETFPLNSLVLPLLFRSTFLGSCAVIPTTIFLISHLSSGRTDMKLDLSARQVRRREWGILGQRNKPWNLTNGIFNHSRLIATLLKCVSYYRVQLQGAVLRFLSNIIFVRKETRYFVIVIRFLLASMFRSAVISLSRIACEL